MTAPIRFFVAGLPAPGGSKRAFVVNGRACVTDDAKRNKPWRAQVSAVAQGLYPGPPLNEPLALELTFVIARPKGHFGSGRNAAKVKLSAPSYPATKPDATKLLRAVEDALTGILWRDDALVVEQRVSKVYGERPGVLVSVHTMAEGDPVIAPIPADTHPPDGWPPRVGRSAEVEDFALTSSPRATPNPGPCPVSQAR